jgi:hypothetical protein
MFSAADSATCPSRHSRHEEEVCLVLVDPSQRPHDGFDKQLHEALNRHLHLLKHFS